jgi:hypothetical protein
MSIPDKASHSHACLARAGQYPQRQGAGRTAANAGVSTGSARSAGRGTGVFAQSRRVAVVPQQRGGLDTRPEHQRHCVAASSGRQRSPAGTRIVALMDEHGWAERAAADRAGAELARHCAGCRRAGSDSALKIGERGYRRFVQTGAVSRCSKTHTHSMTSSARASSVGGTSRPTALAVLRLMTSSNLVGCNTGRSVGFSPLRTRPA